MKVTIEYFKFESVIVITMIDIYFEGIPVPGFISGFIPNSYSAKTFDYLKTSEMVDKKTF